MDSNLDEFTGKSSEVTTHQCSDCCLKCTGAENVISIYECRNNKMRVGLANNLKWICLDFWETSLTLAKQCTEVRRNDSFWIAGCVGGVDWIRASSSTMLNISHRRARLKSQRHDNSICNPVHFQESSQKEASEVQNDTNHNICMYTMYINNAQPVRTGDIFSPQPPTLACPFETTHRS